MAYKNLYFDRQSQMVHLWTDERDGEKPYICFPFERYGYIIDPNGKDVTLNGLKVKKVKQWSKEAEKQNLVFEHDVRPETRVLIDRYYKSDDVSINHTILFLDIEIAKEGKYSKPIEALNTITSIAYYDTKEKRYHCLLLDIDERLTDKVVNGTFIRRFDSEIELLSAFIIAYSKIKADIISSWNGDFFDMPYLYNRLSNVLGIKFAKKLSPIGIVEVNSYGREYSIRIAGVSQLDYLALYKNFTYSENPRYTLDAISKKELKRGKVEYEGSLDSLFRDDIDKFIEYNVSDVELLVAMDAKLDFIAIALGICHKGHVPYEDFPMSSRIMDGALVTDCKRNGLIANKTSKTEDSHGEKAEGAFVKLPSPGIYEFVYDLDLESEYPNNIKSLNISPETKWGRVKNYDVDDFSAKKDRIYEIEQILIKHLTDVWENDDSTNYFRFSSHDEFVNFLNEKNLSISSAGILYSMDKKGLIPDILTKWGVERTDFRTTAKKYHNEGDMDMYRYYDRKQLVQKILLNSLYGVLLLPTFRFYDRENGESVTKTGVSLVKFSAKMGNHYYQKHIQSESPKDYCIYSDTDSVFFEALPMIFHRYGKESHPDEFMVEKTLEIAKEVEDFINKSYSFYAKRFHNINMHTWKIKQEMVGKTAFWRDAKKRYAMWIINKNGLNCDEVEVKGFDSVRSDFPKDFRIFMNQCIIDILKKTPKEEMNVKMRYERDRVVKHANIRDILLPTGVKEISKFKYGQKGTPIHVKSAQNYNKLLDLFKIENLPRIDDGDKIMWGYMKSNPYGFETLAIRGYEDPEQIVEFLEKFVNRKSIFEDRLQNKMQAIWDNLGWGQVEIEEENSFF